MYRSGKKQRPYECVQFSLRFFTVVAFKDMGCVQSLSNSLKMIVFETLHKKKRTAAIQITFI